MINSTFHIKDKGFCNKIKRKSLDKVFLSVVFVNVFILGTARLQELD